MKLTIALLGFILLLTYQVILGYTFDLYSYFIGVYVIHAFSWAASKEVKQ